MCEPVSLSTLFFTTLGLSAASATAGVIGQAQQYNANAANAAQAMRTQNAQTNLGIIQSEAADGRKAQDTQADMLRAIATAKASANEGGVAGNSVDALIGDYYASEGRFMNDLATQGVWSRAQADLDKQGQRAQAKGRINSVSKPDFMGAALRIGGDALGSYTNLWGKDATR